MSSKSSKPEFPDPLPEFVTVGRIRKPHGVRGGLSVEVLSDVEARLDIGSEVEIVLQGQPTRSAVIVGASGRGKALVLRFEGIETREAAEELRGAELEVSRAAVPGAPPGSYYFFELVGCLCSDTKAGELGRVERVVEDGGGLVLEIRRGDQTLLVPFVRAYLVNVDTQGRRLDLELPEGLIETCTSRF